MPAFNTSGFGSHLFSAPDYYEELFRRYEANQPLHTLRDDEPLTDILRTYAQLTYQLRNRIEAVRKQQVVETATGTELERLGSTVGVERQTGEDDERYRRRVEAGYLVAQSKGRYEDLAKVVLTLLKTDPSNVSIEPARETSDPATAIIRTPTSVIDDSPFTQAEIESELREATVGGHRVILSKSDVFTWGDPDNGWGTEWGKSTE